MKLFKKQSKKNAPPRAFSVEKGNTAAFYPVAGGEIYEQLCRKIPLAAAAVEKTVHLVNDFKFECEGEKTTNAINSFFETVSAGPNQTGLSSFVSAYLRCLLVRGSAIGEIVANGEGFYAVLNCDPSRVNIKSENGIDPVFEFDGKRVKRPDLILFSALNPAPGEIRGRSLLEGLPFMGNVLETVFKTIGQNWEHAGNLRYSVTYRPQGELEGAEASKRAAEIAGAWQSAMSEKSGTSDFVAVGDVEIKVIGADGEILNSEIPVRQLLEQIIAKTGVPPYMLGLSWNVSERMSAQQADAFTTELREYRRLLTPVLLKTGQKWLDLNGINEKLKIAWNPVTLQDETEHAKALYYRAKASQLEN